MKIIEAAKNKYKQPNLDCINLLTSILLCYPELGIIAYEPHSRGDRMYLSYIIEKVISDKECKQLENFIQESIFAYQFLEKLETEIIEVEVCIKEKATFVNVRRDIKTFFQPELRLISNLVREKLTKDLPVNEKDRIALADIILTQTEKIDTTLASLKLNPPKEHMVGVRDDGKVIVYND